MCNYKEKAYFVTHLHWLVIISITLAEMFWDKQHYFVFSKIKIMPEVITYYNNCKETLKDIMIFISRWAWIETQEDSIENKVEVEGR